MRFTIHLLGGRLVLGGWPRPARRITRFIGCYQRIGCWSPTDEALERRTFSSSRAHWLPVWPKQKSECGAGRQPQRSAAEIDWNGSSSQKKKKMASHSAQPNKKRGKYENISPEQQHQDQGFFGVLADVHSRAQTPPTARSSLIACVRAAILFID